jgi:uncharacterized surface protein with fasciclin (FAS1) repeats
MNYLRLFSAAAAAAFVASAAFAQEAPAEVAAPAAEIAAPAPAAPAFRPIAPAGDLVETLKASGQFTVLVKALDATGLTPVLKNNKNLTVLAPTDAAFAKVPAADIERLMNPDNAAELQGVLTYHLINAPVDSKKVKGAKGPVKTVAGTDVLLDGSGEAVKANSAQVLQADVRSTNGILHVVDQVLSPSDPTIAKAAAEAAEAARPAEQTPAV